MLPIISVRTRITKLPNAPGIARALSANAEVWDMVHHDAIKVGRDGDAGSNWPTVDAHERSYLAIFPASQDVTEVEFFLSPDVLEGVRGILSHGSINWGNSEYSMLQFPRA